MKTAAAGNDMRDLKEPKGSLALIGGRFEPDNDALYSALRERCDGRIAILSMASGYPQEVGEEIVDEFRAQGFYAELVPIFYETRDRSPFDPTLVERLRAFGSVFFSGGDQSRIVGTLIQDNAETPALLAIRELYREGGLIAGSSAGAAIMSGPMILGGTSLHALSRGIDARESAVDDFDAFRMGRGLGFFQWGVVDQHFLARGRVGRLICAARHSGEHLAFGVDENSALIVRGSRGEVVGETGVLLIDLRKAKTAGDERPFTDIRVSYVDDGDAIDLAQGKPIAADDKHRTRVSKASYRSPAPVHRNAFASYGLHDIMLRLVEGDLRAYSEDSASAFDPMTGKEVTLNIRRKPRRSRALQARRLGGIRYSAFDFRLDIRCVERDICPLPASNRVQPPQPSPEAQLLLLGNAPMQWRRTGRESLLEHLVEPVGILPTASGEPAAMADRYLKWLSREGLHCEVLPIALNNIERASRNRALLKEIDQMGSLLLTGGDQRRLTEALLHCAEATPVLHHLVTAFERGVPIVTVAAAASAMGDQMIAEGDSLAALRYGSSQDASGNGVIIEPGMGLTSIGLIDQHFTHRHRLGRLLVACAEQGHRYGFGLCEGAGLIIHGGDREIEAIGEPGVVVLSLADSHQHLSLRDLRPEGVQLHFLEGGRRIATDALHTLPATQSGAGTNELSEVLDDLAEDHREVYGNPELFDAAAWRATALNRRIAAG